MSDPAPPPEPRPAAPWPPTPQPGGRPAWWRRPLRLALRLGLAGLLLSVGWAALYRLVPPPVTFTMLGGLMAGRGIEKDWVPLEAVSPHLVRAVIGAEDSGFCAHGGFDWGAIGAAWEANDAAGRVRRGGSTLSMQTAKNAFLWQGRSWLRKGLEAWFTLLAEGLWPKRRILEVYLNVAEWGKGVYGAEAAARAHFGKAAAALTPREAALLAAVLPNPRGWSAGRPGPYVQRRAGLLQQRARQVAAQGLDACVR
ncbi:MAG TPA: monofunctional biosynthetic peptidoglycan transglycosylase [Alphaproteobacteria bacterium]|nr:monofunctional biosynthetic peptidoglycan transglycosylase [Alphaproteobacteria bacterium]